jgi:hypothetical protein
MAILQCFVWWFLSNAFVQDMLILPVLLIGHKLGWFEIERVRLVELMPKWFNKQWTDNSIDPYAQEVL